MVTVCALWSFLFKALLPPAHSLKWVLCTHIAATRDGSEVQGFKRATSDARIDPLVKGPSRCPFCAPPGSSTLAVHSMAAQAAGEAQEEETAQRKAAGVCFLLFSLSDWHPVI